MITDFGDVEVTPALAGMLNKSATSSHEIENDNEMYFLFLHIHIKEQAAERRSAARHDHQN